jgi:hypothetical protein
VLAGFEFQGDVDGETAPGETVFDLLVPNEWVELAHGR